MKRAAREWVRKAEDDYRLAATIAGGSEPFHDQLCFHCQQSAEKYLKAVLEELGQSIPRTHDLNDLVDLLGPEHPTLRSLRRGLVFLTEFAVERGIRETERPSDNRLRLCVGPAGSAKPVEPSSAASRLVARAALSER